MSLIALIAVCLGLGLVEIFLRSRYGLGRPPLYVADARMGYRLAPNQQLKRLGNRIEINRFSMRGAEITEQRPENTLRILLLGDSIVNGGWWTDQGEILSQHIQARLAQHFQGTFEQVQVLNASANSWGPRNELGYVARFGLFESQVVVVVLNTDDLFAIAPTSVQVGRDRNYPQRNPPLALVEALTKLRQPRPLPELEALHQQGGDRVGSNLEALRQLQLLSQQADSRLILAMTPLRRELEGDGPRDYELVARQRLTDFTQAEQIPYLDFLPLFAKNPDISAYYRDHIHLSPEGDRFVSDQLSQFAIEILDRPLLVPAPMSPEDTWEDPWQS